MTFKRISDETVQCIVSGRDLDEYGLSFSDIMERGEKSEIFIRNMLEIAQREAGFSASSPGVSMQITPMQNNSLIVTLSEGVSGGVIGLLAHIKEVLTEGLIENGFSVDGTAEENALTHFREGLLENDLPASVRVVAFDSIGEVISFANTIGNAYGIRSSLYKNRESFFLVLDKGRMSWDKYNRLTSDATEYGVVGVADEDRMAYLYEHGELMIGEKALQALKGLGK